MKLKLSKQVLPFYSVMITTEQLYMQKHMYKFSIMSDLHTVQLRVTLMVLSGKAPYRVQWKGNKGGLCGNDLFITCTSDKIAEK